MGACYSISLKVNLIDEEAAIKALNDYIDKDTSSNYSLEKHYQQGVTTETFDDLMRIFFAGWKGQEVDIHKEADITRYENCFCASYGWEYVMTEMFKVLTPFVQDGTELYISIDNDYDKLVVRDGKCIWLH